MLLISLDNLVEGGGRDIKFFQHMVPPCIPQVLPSSHSSSSFFGDRGGDFQVGSLLLIELGTMYCGLQNKFTSSLGWDVEAGLEDFCRHGVQV